MNRNEVCLRPGALSDLDDVIALERGTEFAPHWPRDSYVKILATPDRQEWGDPEHTFLVSTSGDCLVGFAAMLLQPRLPGCGCADEERTAELESVVVAAGVRRQGTGRMLLQELKQWSQSRGATELVLEVRASSEAVGFYLALGFEQIGRRRSYYRNPVDDAVLMRLPLR